MDDTRRQEAHAKQLLFLFLGLGFAFWHLRNPILATTSGTLNGIVESAFIILPWWILIQIFSFRTASTTVLCIILVLPLLVYTTVALVGTMVVFTPSSFEQVGEIAWNGSYVRVYRTNGGVFDDFGIQLRQERTILPGLRLVRSLTYSNPCQLARINATKDGFVTVEKTGPCANIEPAYQLARFVYF